MKVYAVVVAMFVALCLIAAMLSACGAPEKQDSKGSDQIDKSKAYRTLLMPDDFPSVVMKCDGGGRMVYVTSQSSEKPPQLQVLDDARCPGGERSGAKR